MTTENNINKQQVHPVPLSTRVLQGAGIAAILVVLFLSFGGEPNSLYLQGSIRWMILPLIMVPIAGALGGVVFFVLDHMRYEGGAMKALANLISFLIYLFLLLMSFVLGMNGPN